MLEAQISTVLLTVHLTVATRLSPTSNCRTSPISMRQTLNITWPSSQISPFTVQRLIYPFDASTLRREVPNFSIGNNLSSQLISSHVFSLISDCAHFVGLTLTCPFSQTLPCLYLTQLATASFPDPSILFTVILHAQFGDGSWKFSDSNLQNDWCFTPGVAVPVSRLTSFHLRGMNLIIPYYREWFVCACDRSVRLKRSAFYRWRSCHSTTESHNLGTNAH